MVQRETVQRMARMLWRALRHDTVALRRGVVAAAVGMAIAAAGCGGPAQHAAQAAATRKAATAPVPTYRAGQFCRTRLQSRYRGFGFACRDQHLRAL
jgi:hypothetical protein